MFTTEASSAGVKHALSIQPFATMLFHALSALSSILSARMLLDGVFTSRSLTSRLYPSLMIRVLTRSISSPHFSLPLMERTYRSSSSGNSFLSDTLHPKSLTDMWSGSNLKVSCGSLSTSYENIPSYTRNWFMRKSMLEGSFFLSLFIMSIRNWIFSSLSGVSRYNLISGAAKTSVFTLTSPFSSLFVCRYARASSARTIVSPARPRSITFFRRTSLKLRTSTSSTSIGIP